MEKFKSFKSVKTLSTLAFTSVLLLSAHGTSYAQKGFDAGLRSVIQASTLINKEDQATGPELDFKVNTRFAYGIGAGYNFNKHMGVGIDLLFAKEGQGYKGTTTTGADPKTLYNEFAGLAAANQIAFSGPYTADISLSLIKIPIMFRYAGNNTKTVFFNSFIGPEFNMLSKTVIKVNGTEAKFTGSGMEAKDAYKKMSTDFVLGLGAGINAGKKIQIGAGIRIDYGLGDIEDKDVKYSSSKFYPSGRSATNNASGGFYINVSYKFIKKAPEKKADPKKPGAKGAPTPKKK